MNQIDSSSANASNKQGHFMATVAKTGTNQSSKSAGCDSIHDTLLFGRSTEPEEIQLTEPVSDLSEEEDEIEIDEPQEKRYGKVLVDYKWPPSRNHNEIPLPTMLQVMKVFGPEGLHPWRKDIHKLDKSSIIRLFKQWNPHFFVWFHKRKGIWVPLLGFQQESARRKLSRKANKMIATTPQA